MNEMDKYVQRLRMELSIAEAMAYFVDEGVLSGGKDE